MCHLNNHQIPSSALCNRTLWGLWEKKGNKLIDYFISLSFLLFLQQRSRCSFFFALCLTPTWDALSCAFFLWALFRDNFSNKWVNYWEVSADIESNICFPFGWLMSHTIIGKIQYFKPHLAKNQSIENEPQSAKVFNHPRTNSGLWYFRMNLHSFTWRFTLTPLDYYASISAFRLGRSNIGVEAKSDFIHLLTASEAKNRKCCLLLINWVS